MSGSSVETAEVLVLAAAALHAGFQLTVSVLVYPALLRAEPFAPAHDRHSRSIVPLVLLVYVALVASGVDPARRRPPRRCLGRGACRGRRGGSDDGASWRLPRTAGWDTDAPTSWPVG